MEESRAGRDGASPEWTGDPVGPAGGTSRSGTAACGTPTSGSGKAGGIGVGRSARPGSRRAGEATREVPPSSPWLSLPGEVLLRITRSTMRALALGRGGCSQLGACEETGRAAIVHRQGCKAHSRPCPPTVPAAPHGLPRGALPPPTAGPSPLKCCPEGSSPASPGLLRCTGTGG